MNKAQVLFKTIDLLTVKPQNPFNYDHIYCIKNIPYSDADPAITCGDLYFNPAILKDGRKHPIIFNVHGGGFVMGDKSYRRCLCEYYADKGCYVYNINFRTPPQVELVGSISDVVAGVNYIKNLAEDYSIDLDKIVVTGDSSGAYLASYVAALKFEPSICEPTGLPPVEVDIAALMLHSGSYDMVKMLGVKLPLGVIPQLASMFAGYDLGKNLENIKSYKFYDYISSIDFVNDKWCPTFISWSDADFVCVDQGRPMAEKLMKNCPKVATFYADGSANHCFHLMMKKPLSMKCLENSMEFIKSVFDEIDEKREKPEPNLKAQVN